MDGAWALVLGYAFSSAIQVFVKNGVAFAGIMAFLASDFVVPPRLKINANSYGWRFAA